MSLSSSRICVFGRGNSMKRICQFIVQGSYVCRVRSFAALATKYKSGVRPIQPSIVLFAVLLAVCQMPAADRTIDNGRATFGTAIEWTGDFEVASQRAREQSKLIFVIHISGNFTKQTFT